MSSQRNQKKRNPKDRVPRLLSPPQVNQVRRIIKQDTELKYFISQYNLAPQSTTPSLLSLTEIPQGVTDITRVGDRLELKSLEVRGCHIGGDAYNNTRLVFFTYKPNQVPVSSNILLVGPSAVIDPFSLYSHDYRRDYHIIHDMTFTSVGLIGGSATQPPQSNTSKCFHFTTTNFPRQVQFAGGGLTGTNKIWFVAVGDSAVLTHPLLNFSAKITFTDS